MTKIRLIRKQRGVSQRELAEFLGKSIRTVQRWEADDVRLVQSQFPKCLNCDDVGCVKCEGRAGD